MKKLFSVVSFFIIEELSLKPGWSLGESILLFLSPSYCAVYFCTVTWAPAVTCFKIKIIQFFLKKEPSKILTQLRNTLHGFNIRLDEEEKQIMIWKTKQWKSLRQSNIFFWKQNKLRYVWDINQNTNNIHILGVLENKREIKNLKKFQEFVMETFPNLGKDIGIQVEETQRVPS